MLFIVSPNFSFLFAENKTKNIALCPGGRKFIFLVIYVSHKK